MPLPPEGLAQFVKDYAGLLTMIFGSIGIVVRWVTGRFGAYETKLVQQQNSHDLEIRRLKAEHREDRRVWEERERQLEDDLRHTGNQLAQLSRIHPDELLDLPRRGRRPGQRGDEGA